MTWDDARLEQLRELAGSPLKPSSSQIADAMGVGRNAIIGACRRHGIKLQLPSCSGRVARAKKIEPIEKHDPLHISFLNLKSSHCRYPYGDIAPYTYCGHPKQDGSSYCSQHHRLVYVKPIKREPRIFIAQRGRAA